MKIVSKREKEKFELKSNLTKNELELKNIKDNFNENDGVILGQCDGASVVTNFFTRSVEKLNSNMIVMGEPGMGKSYFAKILLSQLAAGNSKVFVLDPENEYQTLANRMGGKYVNVGEVSIGIINPFHVLSSSDSTSLMDGETNIFSEHLLFLEQFFKDILYGVESYTIEELNNLIVKLYRQKGINKESDFSKLTAEDYPTFSDLYALIEDELKTAKFNYNIENLCILKSFFTKFVEKDRDASILNGKTTLSLKENFAVLNFQSLLKNKNKLVSNAQMLLVLRWIENEIVKNQLYNYEHKTNRKIIVLIDEAHAFIDPKYPVALDFMHRVAKQIRKYNGMEVIITQRVKDFVGHQETENKSIEIMNMCQYSLLFALSQSDLDELLELDSKFYKINDVEKKQIVNNPRGHAFFVSTPTSKINLEITVSDEIRLRFE